jgi:hypothetical protein
MGRAGLAHRTESYNGIDYERLSFAGLGNDILPQRYNVGTFKLGSDNFAIISEM